MALTRPRAAQIYDIDYKQATRVVTVSDITLSGGAPSQVDGVNLSLKDRVLVTGQDTASENGIYYVTTLGSGSNGTWSRSLDTDVTGELLSGTIVMVTEGLIYADTQWKLTSDNPIVIGTTPLTFVQNYSANSISSGTSNVSVLTNSSVLISSAGSANVIKVDAGAITVAGNIVPASNVTYSLGNDTNRFSNLWLSNTTIYIGNVTVGATDTALTVNGSNVVVTTANNDIQTSGNISATGNITTTGYFLGNVFFANGITASKIYSGTSEVNVTSSGGNVNVTVGGTSNVAVFSTAGEYITGILSATGNVTGGNILTDGLISATSNITAGNLLYGGGVVSGTGNIYGANLIVSNIESVTGNITGGNILTDGVVSATGNVSGNNFVGNVVATTVSATANITGGNVLTGGVVSATANITGSNLLTGGVVSATANITGGNLLTSGLISSTGNITTDGYVLGNVFYANGITASKIYSGTSEVNVTSSGGNVNVSIGGTTNVAVYTTTGEYITGILSASGNVTGDNLITAGLITATGNVTGGNILTSGLISATSTITASANINGGNILTDGLVSATGNATAGNILTAGIVSSTGNATAGNILTAGLISATGAVYSGNVYTSGGISLTGNTITSSGDTLTIDPNGSGAVDGNVVIAGNLSVQGNVTYIDSNVITTNEKSITLANNVNTGSLADGSGIDVGNNNLAYWRFNNATTSWQSNIGLTPAANGTLNLGGTSNYWANVYAGNTIISGAETVTSNITGGNLLTAGLVSATGNVTGNYLFGNAESVTGVNTFSNITVTGGSFIAANTISTLLTLVAGNNIVLTANNTSKSLQIDYSSSGGTSIFATGGDMGLVDDPVTSSEDLGNVTSTATTSYDLGQLGVQGVVSNSDLINYQITGNKFANDIAISTTANLTAANLTLSSSNQDVRGWYYVSGNTFSIASQTTSPTDVLLNSVTGTKMYVIGGSNIYQYTLGTANAVSTASYDSISFNFSSQDSSPQSGFMDSTNTVFFMLGATNKTVYQYTLSSSNIGTLSYSSKSFSVNSQETAPTAIAFNPDLSSMFVVGTTNKTVYQYGLTTPGNVATALYTASPPGSFSVAAQESNPTGIAFNSDGTKMYIVGSATDNVYQYNLSSAYDVTTASYTNKFYLGLQEGNTQGIYFNVNASFAYSVGSDKNAVFQYNTGNGTIYVGNSAFISSSVQTSGNIYSMGNVAGGNILTTGIISSTGNILTAGIMSSTGNATHGNILTAGIVSATGNITAGNVLAANYYYANGTPFSSGGVTVGKSLAMTLIFGG